MHTSTVGVHGDVARPPADETAPIAPGDVYQATKAEAEALALDFHRRRGLPVTVVRPGAIYGPGETRNVFKGFGGACEATNNGDAVVRYDQLADRWLVVMPTFRRGPLRPDQPQPGRDGDPAQVSVPGQAGQPGQAARLFVPAPSPPVQTGQPPQRSQRPQQPGPQGPYSMCYAVSTGPDPFGPYYRYEFLRPLFPDFPAGYG